MFFRDDYVAAHHRAWIGVGKMYLNKVSLES